MVAMRFGGRELAQREAREASDRRGMTLAKAGENFIAIGERSDREGVDVNESMS